MKNVLAFVLFSLFCVTFGQEKSSIDITVLDNFTNKPLQDVEVRIDGNELTQPTDNAGNVFFTNLEADTYKIIFNRPGYDTIERSILLSENEHEKLTIRMIPLHIEYSDIEISATRGNYDSPITYSELKTEELEERLDVRDLPSTLKTLPSMNFHSENGNGIGYTYVRLRGFDQRRVSVFINGIPQNDPEEHNVYWINFYDLMNSVESIQVQRGAGLAFYGPPAIAGFINVKTSEPTGRHPISVEAGYGSFNTKKFALETSHSLISDNLKLKLRVARVETDGYRNAAYSEFWRLYASAHYAISENQSIALTMFGGPQEDGLAFYGIPKSYNVNDELRKTNYSKATGDREYFHQPQFQLHHNWKLSEDVSLSNKLFYIKGYGFFDFDASWGTAGYFRLPEGTDIPANVTMRAATDKDHIGWLPTIEWNNGLGRTIVGGEFRFYRGIQWGRIETGNGFPIGVVGEDANRHFYEFSSGKNIYSLYAIQDIQLSEKISMKGAVQFVYQQYKIYDEAYDSTEFSTPYTFVNPKFGVMYKHNRHLSTYLNVAYTRREPPLKNLYDATESSWGVRPQFEKNEDGSFDFDSPLVKPEKLLDIELGTRFAFHPVSVNLVGYWMDFRDEIVPSGGLDVYGQPRVGNAEHTRHIGIEVEGMVDILNNLELAGNLNISRNRFIGFTEYVEGVSVNRDDNVIANAPELLANLRLTYNWENFRASLSMHHTGEQYADNSHNPDDPIVDNVTIDAFTVFNAHASYMIELMDKQFDFSLSINNIFDTKYLTNAFGADNFFPAAGRNMYVGATFMF